MLKKCLVLGIVCILMLIAIPVSGSNDETERNAPFFNWIKANIFVNCHVEVTDDAEGLADVGNAPPILVWSTVTGNVEITTPLRHKTLSGRTKGILIHSAGAYGNNPFFIDRNAAICIVTTY